LKLLSPEVYTAALRGDVKPLVPGCWLVLALSCYFWLPCVLVVSLMHRDEKLFTLHVGLVTVSLYLLLLVGCILATPGLASYLVEV